MVRMPPTLAVVRGKGWPIEPTGRPLPGAQLSSAQLLWPFVDAAAGLPAEPPAWDGPPDSPDGGRIAAAGTRRRITDHDGGRRDGPVVGRPDDQHVRTHLDIGKRRI